MKANQMKTVGDTTRKAWSKPVLAVLLAMSAISAGCNTVEGAGKDIERGGEKIQGAANR